MRVDTPRMPSSAIPPLSCDVVESLGLVSIYVDYGACVLVVVRGRSELRAWWRTRGYDLAGRALVGSA